MRSAIRSFARTSEPCKWCFAQMKADLKPVLCALSLTVVVGISGDPGWSESDSVSAFARKPEAGDCEIQSGFMMPDISEPRKMAERVSVKILSQGSSSSGTIIGRRKLSRDSYSYKVLTVSHGVSSTSGQIEVRTYDSKPHLVDSVDQNRSKPEFSLSERRGISRPCSSLLYKQYSL